MYIQERDFTAGPGLRRSYTVALGTGMPASLRIEGIYLGAGSVATTLRVCREALFYLH